MNITILINILSNMNNNLRFQPISPTGVCLACRSEAHQCFICDNCRGLQDNARLDLFYRVLYNQLRHNTAVLHQFTQAILTILNGGTSSRAVLVMLSAMIENINLLQQTAEDDLVVYNQEAEDVQLLQAQRENTRRRNERRRPKRNR